MRDDSAERVEDEAFEWMVVERAKRVGNVEAVVDRVDVSVEELVRVEIAVPDVLPRVENESRRERGRKVEDAVSYETRFNATTPALRSITPLNQLTRQRRTAISVHPTNTPKSPLRVPTSVPPPHLSPLPIAAAPLF